MSHHGRPRTPLQWAWWAKEVLAEALFVLLLAVLALVFLPFPYSLIFAAVVLVDYFTPWIFWGFRLYRAHRRSRRNSKRGEIR